MITLKVVMALTFSQGRGACSPCSPGSKAGSSADKCSPAASPRRTDGHIRSTFRNYTRAKRAPVEGASEPTRNQLRTAPGPPRGAEITRRADDSAGRYAETSSAPASIEASDPGTTAGHMPRHENPHASTVAADAISEQGSEFRYRAVERSWQPSPSRRSRPLTARVAQRANGAATCLNGRPTGLNRAQRRPPAATLATWPDGKRGHLCDPAG